MIVYTLPWKHKEENRVVKERPWTRTDLAFVGVRISNSITDFTNKSMKTCSM